MLVVRSNKPQIWNITLAKQKTFAVVYGNTLIFIPVTNFNSWLFFGQPWLFNKYFYNHEAMSDFFFSNWNNGYSYSHISPISEYPYVILIFNKYLRLCKNSFPLDFGDNKITLIQAIYDLNNSKPV